VRALEAFASPEGIFAEQVWDEGSEAGQPTESASPLTWAHAEYLSLLRSVQDGKPFEEVRIVRDRYGK
jgi:glucoamylase